MTSLSANRNKPNQYYEVDFEQAMTLRNGKKINCFATTQYYCEVQDFIYNKSLIIRDKKKYIKKSKITEENPPSFDSSDYLILSHSPLYQSHPTGSQNSSLQTTYLGYSRSRTYLILPKYCCINCKFYHKFIELTYKYRNILRGKDDNNSPSPKLNRLRKLYYTHKNKIDYCLKEIENRIFCDCADFFKTQLLLLKKNYSIPHTSFQSTYFDLASRLNKDVAGVIIDFVEKDYTKE